MHDPGKKSHISIETSFMMNTFFGTAEVSLSLKILAQHVRLVFTFFLKARVFQLN